MPINNITQTISELPASGRRGIDIQTVFVTKQEDFQDHLQGTTVKELNTLRAQLNTRIGEINSTATTMNGYANTASAGASTATTKAGEASTSASEALTSRNQAETFKNNASTFATKASQWANNNYNVAVETGKYSAKHWSTVAENVVLDTVKLTGTQTIADVKTFTSSPIVPTPTTDFQVSTKKYVDDIILDISENITNVNNSNINTMKMSDGNSYNTKILDRTGTSSGNVVQGFCIDKKNNNLYTTHTSSTFVEGQQWAVINKFKNKSSLVSVATHSTTPSNIIGHQGISIQYFNDEIKFWASANYQVANSGTKAIRFKINDTIAGDGNSTVTDTEEFKLFPGTGGGSTTPTVSSCGRYLVVEDNASIRVFDINIFTTAGDYSSKCIYEFTIPAYLALQGLACDGNFIYILQGYSDPNENVYLSTYTLDGKLINKNTNFDIGLTNSLQDGEGLHHEPEGLCIANINGVDSLLMIVASGDSGYRYARVYDCGNLDRYESFIGEDNGNYHQLKPLSSIPDGDLGFDGGNKYFLLCPWVGVENKIVGKLYAGRHSSVTSHGRVWVIDIASRYTTTVDGRMSNYSIQSTSDRDTFNLVKVTYNGIEYLAIKLTDSNTPIFRAGIAFSGFEQGCIFKWVNASSITNESVATTSGYNKFSSNIKAPNMFSGSYLPVITGVSNVADFTVSSMYYSVVGRQVSVSGNFSLRATTAGNFTEFTISLPLGSLFYWRAASGSVSSAASSVNVITGAVTGTASNLRVVRCTYKATSISNEQTAVAFSYTLPE